VTAAKAPLPRGGKVIASIPIAPGEGGLALGEGSVWAFSWAAARMTRINPAGNTVAARITLKPTNACPPAPADCGEAAAGDGAAWVSLPDSVIARIDPATNSVTGTIQVGPQPDGIAVSPGAVWVVNRGDPSVSRIDPATNQVVATIRIGPRDACCSEHIALTVGGGAVWGTVPKLGAVVRIDPVTNRVTARIRLRAQSGQPCGFAVADRRAVWLAGDHCASVITRINPRTNKPTGRVLEAASPIGLALGFGSLWVADLDAKAIERVDLHTARVVARLRVGGLPIRLAVGFGSVWVRDDAGRVLRIKPQR
jgi:virginiamycin B lyase